MTCPSCNGTKEGGMAFVHRATGCKLEQVHCSTCSGTGTVADEYPEWLEGGKKLRLLRRGRDLSIGEFARQIGKRAHEVSDAEFGRRDPAEFIEALQ